MQTKYIAIYFLLFLVTFFTLNTESHAEWNVQDSYVEDNLYDVDFHSISNGWAVGWGASRGAVILETNDGGEFWIPHIQRAGTYLFSITFSDRENGWAAGYNTATSSAMLLHSENGGDDWDMELFRDTLGFYVVDFPSPDVGYVCGYGGSIYKTSDGGNQWSRLDTGTELVFHTMQFINEDVGIALAGTEYYNSNQVFRTDDGGESWELDEVEQHMGDYIFAAHLKGNHAYIVGAGGSIMKNELPQGVDSDHDNFQPNSPQLISNFPNPFNSQTVINYNIGQSRDLSFNVFDIGGNLLIERRLGFQIAGTHTLRFDGQALSSGMYYYTVKGSGFELSNRMILLK